MKNSDLYNDFKTRLDNYRESVDLPGIDSSIKEECFIKQMVDSYKRIKFIELLKTKDISQERKNPNSEIYDPLRAAILYLRERNLNEAVWNILLYVHFGKNLKTNYALLKAVYGKLGEVEYWTWDNITNNINDFKLWLDENLNEIKTYGSFGNHRKYQSLKIDSRGSTIYTFSSFFQIVNNDFETFLSRIPEEIKNNKYLLFDYLYNMFKNIQGFGRLALFDFVCMLGKIGIVNAEPEHPYLDNTGPINGAKLLFNSNTSTHELNLFVRSIGDTSFREYPYIMQIIEDSICNWQKSTETYKLFRG